MKRLLLFIGFLTLFFPALAQTQPEPENIYVYVEQMPQFPGGQDSMFAYLAQNIHYPYEANYKNQSGVVFVGFVIDREGKITKPEILRSIAPTLDSEALRVISNMPPWQPGKQNGRPVSVKFTLPVRFQLNTNVSTDSIAINEKVEEQAEFPGGQEAMMRFLATHIKYPAEARNAKIQGRSMISFVVNTDGSLSNYSVIAPLGYGTDDEAIRVLRKMPTWKPGKQNGKQVRVQFNLPVLFQL